MQGGAIWQKENVDNGTISEPYLFAGWERRCIWVKNDNNYTSDLLFELDKNGNNSWKKCKNVVIPAHKDTLIIVEPTLEAEWIRVKTLKDFNGSVVLLYSDIEARSESNNSMFNGVARIDNVDKATGGILYSLGNNRKALAIQAKKIVDGKMSDIGYYKLNESMEIIKKEDMYVEYFMDNNLNFKYHKC